MEYDSVNPEPTEIKRRPRADLQFGLNSHESEYVFTLPYASGDVPDHIAGEVQKKLGEEWEVWDRASRIEVKHKKIPGKRDDEMVRRAFEQTLGDGYDFSPTKIW